MPHFADGFKMLGKYISKSADLSQKAVTTLACLWAFHKRSYSLGIKFKTEIFNRYLALDLTHISASQTVHSQMTLDSKELRETLPSFRKLDFEKPKLIGIIARSIIKKLGGIPKYEWSFGLNTKQSDYVIRTLIGIKTENPTITLKEFIKDGWKYFFDKNTSILSKISILKGMKKHVVYDVSCPVTYTECWEKEGKFLGN